MAVGGIVRRGATAGLVLLATTVASTVIGFMTTAKLDDLADELRRTPPTCADPQNLHRLRRSDMDATGDWYYEDDPVLGRLPQEQLKDFQNLRAYRVLDGSTNTMWVPPSASTVGEQKLGVYVPPRDHRATLTLTLSKPYDVVLVCVVNGYASESARYRNWGRVRTLSVTTDGGVARTVLETLGDCCFQNEQTLNLVESRTSTVKVKILDAYSGQIVFTRDGDYCDRQTQTDSDRPTDPDDPRDPDDGWELALARGCYVGAVPQAGIAEVSVYARP